MSNVTPIRKGPTGKTPPKTPDDWKAELFRAGQAVVELQLKGEDQTEAQKVYDEIERALPEEVRKSLDGNDNKENYVRLFKAGWGFLRELLELKAKMGR